MKKISLILSFLSFLVLMFLVFSPCSWAGGREVTSQKLIAQGKAYYDEADYALASHVFSKALLLSPNNSVAKYYYDLCSAALYYKRDIEFRSYEAGASYSWPNRDPRMEQEEILEISDSASLKKVKNELARKNQETERLKILISKTNELMAEKTALVEKKNNDLAAAKELLGKSEREHAKAKTDWQNSRVAAEKEKTELSQRISDKEKENQTLHQQIAEARQDGKKRSALDQALIENMKTEARKKFGEISALKEELAALNAKVSVQDAAARQREEQNALLEAQLAQDKEALAQYALAAEIKNRELMDLTQQLVKAKENAALQSAVVKEQDQQLALLEEQLAQNKKELTTYAITVEAKDIQAAELTEQLTKAKEDAALQGAAAQDKEQKLGILQEQIEQNTKTIADITQTAENKDRETAGLSAHLAKTNETVADKIQQLQDKDRQIGIIDKRLVELSASLEKANAKWNKSREAYEQRIKKLETALLKYKKLLARNARGGHPQLEEMQDLLFKNRVELARLNNKVIVSEYHLSQGHSHLIEKNRKILQLMEVINRLEQEVLHLQTKMVASQKHQALTDEEIDMTELIKRQDKMISELKNRLVGALSDVAKKEQEIKTGSSSKVSELEAQLIRLSEQLAKTTLSLQRKTEECDLLQAQINEAKKRLDSAERRIQNSGDEAFLLTGEDENDTL